MYFLALGSTQTDSKESDPKKDASAADPTEVRASSRVECDPHGHMRASVDSHTHVMCFSW